MEEYKLRKAYSDILSGFSRAIFKNRPFYIKHFNSVDQGVVDEKYLELLSFASKELINEESRLIELQASGEWTEKDEDWIINHRTYLDNLFKTRDHPLNASTKSETIRIIEVTEKELEEKLNKKRMLVGVTAENWAARRINEFYIWDSLFTDRNCQEKVFSEDEFYELEDRELDDIIHFFNVSMSPFNNSGIKNIAISSFFQSSFSLCEDNIFHFYGKPASLLSFYQTELAIYGKYFRHILTDPDIPFNYRTDPDKLISWHNGDRNLVPPVEVEQKLDKLNSEAVKSGGKLKGAAVMKALQGFL